MTTQAPDKRTLYRTATVATDDLTAYGFARGDIVTVRNYLALSDTYDLVSQTGQYAWHVHASKLNRFVL